MEIGNFKIIKELGNCTQIESKKVRCISDYDNNWGDCEPIKGNLEVGKIYEIQGVEPHSWHTKLYLFGFSKPFNSVHFEEV